MNQFTQAVEALKRKKVIKYDSDISRDLGISKSIVSEYRKFRPLTESFIEQFNNKYGVHGVTLSISDIVATFQQSNQSYESHGAPSKLILPKAEYDMMLNSAISSTALDLICRLLAKVEGTPIEQIRDEVNQLLKDKMKVQIEVAPQVKH